LVQVLHLSNGETLNPKLADQKNRIAMLIDANESDAAIVQSLFAAALSREATESELGKLLEIRNEYGEDRATALQDIAWSILTSSEFTFNH
jgi:hypothetical protein